MDREREPESGRTMIADYLQMPTIVALQANAGDALPTTLLQTAKGS